MLALLVAVAWGAPLPSAEAAPARKKSAATKAAGKAGSKATAGKATRPSAKGKSDRSGKASTGSKAGKAKGAKGATPKGDGKAKADAPKGDGKPRADAAKGDAKAKADAAKAGAAKTGKADAKASAGKKGRKGNKGASDDEGSPGELDKVHRVRSGDSLWTISRKYDVSAAELRRLNGEKKLRMLHPGQLVLIKKGDPRKPEEVRPFLKDWTRLEPGPGYVIKRPDKNYGRPWAIALVRQAIADLHERFPESTDVFVGDLSGPIGGRILHHVSHKTGRDVDLAYFLKGNASIDDFVEVTPETVDVEKSWQLIESFFHTRRVQFVFMDYSLQPLFRAHAEALGYPPEDLERMFQYPREVTDRDGQIRHVKGHADHLHVRFACPVDDVLCR